MEELSHSLNITFSGSIDEKLRAVISTLQAKYTERRMYETSPHLSFANKFMSAEDSERFAEALVREFEDDSAWSLEFANFRVSDAKEYIFLGVSDESRRTLCKLHDRAINATEGIGSVQPNRKDRRHFAFEPHISIIKLLSGESEEALRQITEEFSGLTVDIETYVVTAEVAACNNYSIFASVREIHLKPNS